MQLADPFSLSTFIEESVRSRRVYRRRGNPLEFTRVGKRRKCTCGRCESCLDNARWDRVFHEKFEDPDYYKPRSVRQGSSLNWLC
jgi:hypothetical protein